MREFPYPTAFEPPKLGSRDYAYSSGKFTSPLFGNLPLQLAIPPTPSAFTTQDIGVTLEVKPTTYPDQRIDLDLSGENGQGGIQVTDFDGFINYGVPIAARLTDTGPPTVLTPGTIVQPVFNLRSISTDLQVLDGQTAVLGGLIREDTQEINDKVPGPWGSPPRRKALSKQGVRAGKKERDDFRHGAIDPHHWQAAVHQDTLPGTA